MKVRAFFFLAVMLAPGALAQETSAPGVETVSFAETTPLAGNAELSRRLLSPLTVVQMRAALVRAGQSLRDQSVTVANEKFLVHVPPQMPAGGYAAPIFVPAAKVTSLPKGWQSVLDSHGVIFVGAQDSGNNSYDMSRRMPLAVIAAVNALHQYKVDPDRVFVGGMSGGSRVAMRLALGYPDLFAGALLPDDGVGLRHHRRTLLVHCARSALRSAGEKPDRMLRWAVQVQQRRGAKIAVVALANKLARIVWALLANGGDYQPVPQRRASVSV